MQDFLPFLTAFGGIGVSLAASVHTVLYKRDSRAAVAWVGLIWLVPFVGALLYLLFGINRVRRRTLRPTRRPPGERPYRRPRRRA